MPNEDKKQKREITLVVVIPHDALREIVAFDVLGKHIRDGNARQKPIGDRIIGAVRDAIWEAWKMGLDGQHQSFYSRIPFLDRDSKDTEPEM